MNAAEKIQAAIVRLEELRAESAPGPWGIEPTGEYFDPQFDDMRVLHAPLHPGSENYDRYIIRDGSYAAEAGGFKPADAELIVTLHRTIDAQLAILKLALHVEQSEVPFRTVRREVKLAEAICGPFA